MTPENESLGLIGNAPLVHGVSCNKAHHRGELEYNHGRDDNQPFEVAGVTYCGRCHAHLPPETHPRQEP